jgi:peptide/nickel transport system permease protein
MMDTTLPIPKINPRKSRSFWGDAFRYMRRDRLTVIALVLLALLTIASFAAPPIVENLLEVDPNRTRVPDRFLPPGTEGHVLGTDNLGRDQLIRLLYGGRISLAIAYAASLMSIAIGITLGLLAGYYRGWIDDIITWFINTISSIPVIFLLLVASALWNPSPELLVVFLAFLGWIPSCRLVRGEVLSLREREYILAARAVGTPTPSIFLHHLFPNLLPLALVYLSINAGTLILVESALSYLGVGVQPPTPSWGNMLTEARSFFARGTHLIIWPGILIVITVLCFYWLGDGLRDALDPRTVRKS